MSGARDVKSKGVARRLYEDDDFLVFSENATGLPWRCLFKDPEIRSVRELASIESLGILRQKIYQLLDEASVGRDRVCMFFDYQGKGSRLFLEIADISSGIQALEPCGKFIYFDTLLKNIRMDKEYYRRDIFYIRQA